MLVKNLKSIGTTAKITLFIVWLGAIIGLGIFAIKQATETAYDADAITEETLNIRTGDTLKVKMVSNSIYEYDARRRGGLNIKYNENQNSGRC